MGFTPCKAEQSQRDVELQEKKHKFFKDFTNHGKKTNRGIVFSCKSFPTFLNTGTTDAGFQQSGKQDSLKQLLRSSASMKESSGSQFFRTTTGIQSGPDAFGKSRFIMTFLTILGVTEIMCSFKLVLAAYSSITSFKYEQVWKLLVIMEIK